MPIYDSDGTSAYQIGKLYDNDGTANCQNGKLYDSDGTASYLIYTAETALYENGAINYDLTGDFATWYKTGSEARITFNADSIRFHTQHIAEDGLWSRAIIWSNKQVNLAGYATLNAMTTMPSDANWGYGAFSILITQSITHSDNPHFYVAKSVETTSPGTLTMDLSAHQGSYYVGVCGSPNGSWHYGGTQLLHKLWLE